MKKGFTFLIINFALLFSSCKKLVEVDPPITTIVSEQAFSNDYNATASIIVIYSQLIAEAKFIRSICYFYLVNIYGDVPFLTTTSYKDNSIAPRTASATIYSNIIDDLTSSIDALPNSFAAYNNERIRATKWSAMAL